MKFNNLAFIPVAIDVPEISFTHEKYPTQWHWWSFEQLLDYKDTETFSPKSWKELPKEYEVYKRMAESLPLVDFSNVRVSRQDKEVAPHYDVHKFHKPPEETYEHFVKNEPCGYRFVLKGSADTLQLYLKDKWVTALIPQVPCCYLINTTSVLHRVLEDKNRLTMYVRGTVDETKHVQLIEKSLELYKDYALYI